MIGFQASTSLWRATSALLTLGLILSVTAAQESSTGEPENTEEVSIRMRPAPEANPPLKDSLIVPFIELKSGNAAIFYYRAMLLIPRDKEAQFSDAQLAWLDMPLGELPQDEIQTWLLGYQGSLHELREAAVRQSCDWDLGLRELNGTETIMFLLPELQEMRQLARVLRLKSRLAIAQNDFDEAVESLQLGYCLARDLGRSPTLIHGLVGIAVASMMNQSVVDWIDAGGPNLYWALTTLPDPLVDLRNAMQQEMNLPLRIFPFLRDPENTDWSEEQWRDALAKGFDQLSEIHGQLFPSLEGKVDRQLLTRFAAVGWLLTYYPQAKQALIDSGMDADRVAAMPVGQVLAIQASRMYQYIYHQHFKWFYIPLWQARKESLATEARLVQEGYLGAGLRSKEIIPLASMLMPGVRGAMFAEGRLRRDMAALRVLEALRAYAATQGGKWPADLNDVTQTPVPQDPITGREFPFHVRDGKAELLLSAEPDAPQLKGRRYVWEAVPPE